MFELDEGGQLASHQFCLATISIVHAIFKLYSCNRGTGFITYLLVATVLLHAQTLALCSWIVAAVGAMASELVAWLLHVGDLQSGPVPCMFYHLWWDCPYLCSSIFKGIIYYRNPTGFPVIASPSKNSG